MAVPHSVPFPSGGTWFDTLHKTFDDVPVQASNDNAIPTSDFLEAAESLTTLFGKLPLPGCFRSVVEFKAYRWADVLGSMAFTPVKNDMIGNIKVSTHLLPTPTQSGELPTYWYKKVRDRQLAAPADSETLQSLVVNELKTKKHTAAEGLLWLVRFDQPLYHEKFGRI